MSSSQQQHQDIVYPNLDDIPAHQTSHATVSTGSDTPNPYIASPSVANTPMDKVSSYVTTWRQKFEQASRKAEEAAGNVWQHVKTAPNVADTAWGKLSHGSKLLAEGGFDKVFKQTFETLPDEQLRKTYACYLSTSSGPISGTLYISTKKIAFCSDQPISYKTTAEKTAWSYYKLVIPLDKFQGTNTSSNPESPAEKYIEIVTVDNSEFWFMGFVNYDKAVKNLQEARIHAT